VFFLFGRWVLRQTQYGGGGVLKEGSSEGVTLLLLERGGCSFSLQNEGEMSDQSRKGEGRTKKENDVKKPYSAKIRLFRFLSEAYILLGEKRRELQTRRGEKPTHGASRHSITY